MTSDFLIISSIGLLMIFITSMLIYEIFGFVRRMLPRITVAPRLRLMLIVVPIFAAHILNIWIYAFAYFAIENFTSIGGIKGLASMPELDFQTFSDCLYFSSATYTTLGFGDAVPTKDLRMLTAAEALNGLVLMGWTITFTYISMEQFFKTPIKKETTD